MLQFSALLDFFETIFFVFQLPKILELVGLGYTGWFVYRYLLFKVRRIHHHSHHVMLFL
jgi:hypothetical protein